MKQFWILLITIFISSNIQAQSIDEYQQKEAECFSSGDYKCAEKYALAIIELVGEDYDDLYKLYANLGTIQRRLGKKNDALGSYNKAFELNNNSSNVISNRASLKRQLSICNEITFISRFVFVSLYLWKKMQYYHINTSQYFPI